MKLIVKIEIIVLIVVLLIGTGMVLMAEGVFELFHEPVIVHREEVALPTDAPVKTYFSSSYFINNGLHSLQSTLILVNPGASGRYKTVAVYKRITERFTC